MQDRTIEPVLKELASSYPVVTVTGPRQSGKTTLCRKVFPEQTYVNLETPDVRRFAMEDPRGFLATHASGAILDEIQRVPELLSYIQPMVDDVPSPGRFILTGSQQLNITEAVTQSLAGRTGLLTLLPFDSREIRAYMDFAATDTVLLQGFYPRHHETGINVTRALGDYFETYVMRDVRQLINIQDTGLFEKFVRLCAGRTGQLLNLQSLGNDTGISHTTARKWLSILEASYILFQLRPWHANISKRLIKSPKIYFWDVGLASYLLGLEEETQVARDPLRGNLFENMVIADVFKQYMHRGIRPRISFFRDSTGNEVDVVIERGNDLFLVEIKSGQTVTGDYFKGLNQVGSILGDRVKGRAVVYGGQTGQRRSDCTVLPIAQLADLTEEVKTSFAD